MTCQPSTNADLRAKAEKARRLAATLPDAATHRALLALAEEYDRTADTLERESELH